MSGWQRCSANTVPSRNFLEIFGRLPSHQINVLLSKNLTNSHFTMSKRGAEELNGAPLKAGQRPENGTSNGDNLDFEDDYEDEFESEDEVMEAGVDGRPDAEREAEAARGTLCKVANDHETNEC